MNHKYLVDVQLAVTCLL